MKAHLALVKDQTIITIFASIVGLSILLYDLRFAQKLSVDWLLFFDKIQVLSILPCLIAGTRALIWGKPIIRRVLGSILLTEAVYIIYKIGEANMP